MSTKRLILGLLLVVGVAVVVGVLVWGGVREREPEYGGKRLSEWVDGIYSDHRVEGGVGLAADAVRHMGVKKALPYLLKWISYETPAWQVKLFAIVNRVLSPVKSSWQLKAGTKELRAIGATGLLVRLGPRLGPEAEGVLVELRRLVNDPRDKRSATCARIVLPYLGKAALPDLMAGLTNETGAFRESCAIRIRWMVTNDCQARPSPPVFLRCLTDTNQIVALNAALILGELKEEPSLVVPALANSLLDPRFSVRRAAAIALGGFGQDACSAVPALMNLVHETNPVIRQLATNAILKIDPEALEKARAR